MLRRVYSDVINCAERRLNQQITSSVLNVIPQ